ncbi:histidine kinase [Oscillatoriales cyanobacterium USR001]|nr:histidine kinase [Oscillatoriales cyanobacterium USR001]
MNWFETFLATSADAFIEYSQERKYISINPTAAAWLGLEMAEIIGKSNRELLQNYPNNQRLKYIIPHIDPCLEQVLLTGEKRIAIHEANGGDGSIKVYETAYTPVEASDGNVRVFTVGRDITSHYRWQQEKTEQIRRSSHLLWLNAANSPLAMIGWDEQFRIIQWSKRAEEMFGWKEQEVMGKLPTDFPLIYEGDLVSVNDVIAQLKAGESNTLINRNNTKNGKLIWCQWFNSIIRSRDGFTVLSLVEDISDRKRLEAIATERSRLTALAAAVGMALTRHPEDILGPCCEAILQHLNATLSLLWTFNPQENVLELQAIAGGSPALGNPIDRIGFDGGKIALIAQVQRPLFDSGIVSDLALADWGLERGSVDLLREENESGGIISNQQLPANNQKQYINFAGYPLTVEDRVVGVVAIFSDRPLSQWLQEMLPSVADVIALGIERKRAEAELAAAKGFLNSVVENLPVGVFAKDAESLKFVLWNKAGETIAGVTSQEAIGKSDYDFFPKEQADAIAAKDREVLANYQKNQSNVSIQEVAESTTQTRHRGLRILHTRKIPIFDKNGNPQYLLDITEDITERKQVDDSVRLYGQIVENMQIGLYVYRLEDINDDQTLRAIASNPASTLFTGVEMFDILGMTLDEVFPLQRSKGIPQAFAAVIREQKAIEIEDIDCDESGAIVRAFSIKAFPLPNNSVGVAFENITDRKKLESELQLALKQSERSQQLLRTVIDTTPDWIFAKDRNFRYILVNQSFAKSVNIDLEEILGKDDVELGFSETEIFGSPHLNIVGFRADDTGVLTGEIIHNRNEQATFADGSLHIFDTRKIPLRDAEGTIFAVLGFAHDITEQHLAQQALGVSEERFRSLVANIPGIVYRYQWDTDWTMTFMSDAAYSVTGYSATQLMENQSVNYTSIIHPEDVGRVQEIIRSSIENKQYYTLEYRIYAATGEVKWVWEQGCGVCGEDSNVIYVDGVIFDISDRQQAQEALRQKTSELEAVFQALPDLYFRLNADGIILDYLSGSSSDLQIPPEIFLGKQMAEVLPNKVSRQFEQAIQETFENQALVTVEYSLRIPQQGKQTYEARLLPFGNTQVIILARNITERKQAEAQLRDKNQQLELTLQELRKTQAQLIQSEKMSSLGQLVAGIAHEINNPVSFIYGNISHANEYAQSLLQLCSLYQQHYKNPPDEIRDLAEEIDIEFLVIDFPQLMTSMEMGADRIRQIVLSLRNFSRLEESDIKIVDIRDGIDSTLLILQHRLKQNSSNHTIEVVKEYGVLPLVECYPGLLNQVLMNILSNAIDAFSSVKSESVEVQDCSAIESLETATLPQNCRRLPCITIRTSVVQGNKIAILIADNGPGMPESVRNRIFDPFFTTKPVGKGTGLGLSISYQIVVEKHGGMLSCISTPGEGSEFVIEIPIRQK